MIPGCCCYMVHGMAVVTFISCLSILVEIHYICCTTISVLASGWIMKMMVTGSEISPFEHRSMHVLLMELG